MLKMLLIERSKLLKMFLKDVADRKVKVLKMLLKMLLIKRSKDDDVD